MVYSYGIQVPLHGGKVIGVAQKRIRPPHKAKFTEPHLAMLVALWGVLSTLNSVENVLVMFQVIETNVPKVRARKGKKHIHSR